jgi:hypothetical protein
MQSIPATNKEETIMTTLFTILFVSTLTTSPVATLESDKNSNISYVCYIENGNLMLAKALKERSGFKTEMIDTGISTNDIEKVTMELQNDDLCLMISYQNAEALNAYFNSRTLEMNQISLNETTLFAAATATAE